ncbi:MAG: hypothetical protein KGJ11_04685, partial [Candidatus Omnitrophica bacterium]|nr:hypothetical protein [Candidatus Omnitrophota bacterium]
MDHGQGVLLDRTTIFSVESGSLIEGLTGIGGMVLAIIGLAGIIPEMMLSVAVIAIGAGLLLQGMAVAARFSAILSESEIAAGQSSAELRGSVSVETIGGIAGIALGILALIGIVPMVLTASAAVVFGVAIILASRVNYRLNTLDIPYSAERAKKLAQQAVAASSDLQIVIGVTSVTLGILALVGIMPLVLALVAVLCVGV